MTIHSGFNAILRFIWRSLPVLAGLALGGASDPSTPEVVAQAAPWTPSTSVSMRRYVKNEDGRSIFWSRSRRFFFYVTEQGDLERDEQVSELHVVAVTRGARNAAPRFEERIIEFRSRSPIYAALEGVRWHATDDQILFIAMDDRGIMQAFSMDAGASGTTQLSHSTSDVVSFDAMGGSIALIVRREPTSITPSYPAYRPNSDAHGRISPQALQGSRVQFDLLVSFNGSALIPTGMSQHIVSRPTISNDGRSVSAGGQSFDLRTGASASPPDAIDNEATRPPVNVELRESLNDPPAIIASWPSAQRTLSQSDPALTSVSRASWRIIRWAGRRAPAGEGALLLPVGHRPGRRLPLVITPYELTPNSFSPDGTHWGTSDAAQSLAARGFAVLWFSAPYGRPNEGQVFSDMIDDAVDQLDRDELIDPARVGLAGFSRAGALSYFLATHPGATRLMAIVCADSAPMSYSGYLISGAGVLLERSFWQDRATWLAQETSFNVDRVRAPVLFTRHLQRGAPGSPFPDMDRSTLGAFWLNRRPIEYVFFPEGAHRLRRPREQLELMTTVVDWMTFWIMEQEDTDPAKVEQYRRWRRLREGWSRQQAWEHAGHSVGSAPPADFNASSQ